jgi:pimeloyl-ACP methyl ester carboxylesterase
MPDYREIDNSLALSYIFYPRNFHSKIPPNAFDKAVSVDEDVAITCRFHEGDDSWPWIVFFHGNGEVVSDYDNIAPLYTKHKLNLVVADYRGYGSSGGNPTLTDLVHDAPILFKAIKSELSGRGQRDNVWLMGRSLGSISALELAYNHPDQIKGLIVESGFPSITRLILHLGIPTGAIELEPIYEACISMVRIITTPTLIIHGEFDMLVPLREAEDLYNEIGAKDKELVIISGADHNDIMFVGFEQYFETILRFIERTNKGPGDRQ